MPHYERIPLLASLCLAAALSGLIPEAEAQLRLPGPVDRLPAVERLERRVDRSVDRTLEKTDETVDEASEEVDETIEDGVDTVESVTALADDAVSEMGALVAGALRPFVGAVDPDGYAIEAETIVVLVAPEEEAGLLTTASLVSRRDLPALGRVLLVLRKPAGVSLPQSIESLRKLNPKATVDYNHLYRPTGMSSQQGEPVRDGVAEEAAPAGAGISVGIIDSAVMREHHALSGVQVFPADFVTHEAERPLTHGTAVASLVAKSSDKSALIHSASVFFQLPGQLPGATAESLVAALDWMVEQEVDVINLSLAGPGNGLLEAAVAAVTGKGLPLVAAVGNAGPKGPPMFPAAYDRVIGVTAVDRNKRVFRYANRGDYVDFAARGVDMKVADSSTGGYRIESGTSMASPHVAVIVAEILRQPSVDFDAVSSWLLSSAEDLGRRGYDEIFGHGLITRAPVIVSSVQ